MLDNSIFKLPFSKSLTTYFDNTLVSFFIWHFTFNFYKYIKKYYI
jgi:hypothetical protein